MPQGGEVSESVATIAYAALDKAKEVERQVESHEAVCSERYGHINGAIGEIKNFLKWAGTTAFAIIMSLLAFLALQVFNANEATKKATADNAEILRQQIADMRANQVPVAPPPARNP